MASIPTQSSQTRQESKDQAEQVNTITPLPGIDTLKDEEVVPGAASTNEIWKTVLTGLKVGPKEVENLDRRYHANLARLTLGISPAALTLAYVDWLSHLAISPGKQMQLAEKALRKAVRLGMFTAQSALTAETPCCIEPLPQDRRFTNDAWQRRPFNLIYQSFLSTQQWWHVATTNVRGVSPRNEKIVNFFTRQLLDTWSPSNFLLFNPEVIDTTIRQRGINLIRGGQHLLDDAKRSIKGEMPAGTEAFQVGKNLAATPGKVVYRNRLMELIQYTPTTKEVWREPVLMLSAWMMKYYIMDLSQHNSMVKFLVDRGHTVFMISWKNPGSEDRDLSMDDYRKLGIMEALDAISTIIPGEKVHAVGYCLGGILLTIAAATLSRNGDDDQRLASLTLFTTMTDFNDIGEISVFMHPSQVLYLDDMMWKKGYLDPKQAGGGFQLLNSNDLIWSRMLREYLLGERQPQFDLMAWNADGTRMPYRQHSELLHKLFVNNELAQGHYMVEGRPIALSDIHVPIFAVSTERDHVAPWRSVYKLNLQSDACELTFVLSSGGHNVGIVNEPGHPRRRYRIATRKEGDRYMDPDTWLATTQAQSGSWWLPWADWLVKRSTDKKGLPPMGASEKGLAPLCDAPGTYVLER